MNFVTSQSVSYIAHVDTGVLCAKVEHLTPFLLQINKIKSRALLQINKSWYFERFTKYDHFNYLLIQLDESSLLNSVRQVVPQTLASYHERTLCVCGCTRARMRVSLCACVYVCVCVCVCMCVYIYIYECSCIYVCICVRAWVSFFIIHKTRAF